MACKTIAPKHSGTGALRRVARHYVRKAAEELATAPMSDDVVHGARKDLKKSRAALRLLRDALGRSLYQRENALLRAAAHTLNAARDAKVLVQTLESLCKAHARLQELPIVKQLSRELREQEAHLQQLSTEPSQLAPARQALGQVCDHFEDWSVGRHGWSVLGPGIRRIYRNGRRAVPAAKPHRSDTALHEWRKQVKYLRYALRMLSPMDHQELSALEHQAERLSDCLGRSHDLAVLAARAQAFAHQHQHQLDAQPLLKAIEKEQRTLVVDALVEGERLYRLRPRDFERQLARHWRHWRHNGGAH
jgi:CHAD domain-containing protein